MLKPHERPTTRKMFRQGSLCLVLVLLALWIPGSGHAQGPIHVDPLLLGRYVGQYELSPTYVLTILVDSDRIYVRAPGRGIRLLVPASETEFIEVESEVTIKYFENFKQNKYGLSVFLSQTKAILLNFLVNKSTID